jgi:hypothetical protein
MSQTIIELNQEDKNSSSINNGDYTVNLQKPIVINKGDQVVLKSVFVDNRVQNSNTIELKGDILPDGTRDNKQTITIGFGYYKTDLEGTWESVNPTATYQTSAVINVTDNLNIFTGRPFPAFEQVNNPNNNLLEITQINLIMDNYGITSFQNHSSHFLKFPDSNGVLKQYTITADNEYLAQGGKGTWVKDGTQSILQLNETMLKKLRANKYVTFSDFPIIVKKETNAEYLKPNAEEGVGKRPLIQSVITQAHTTITGTYDIYGDEISFTIDSGFYDPDDIAEKLTEKIVNVSYNGQLDSKNYAISRNPLLKTIQQIRIDEGKELTFFDIDSTNNRKFQYATTTGPLPTKLNYLVGSSQFGLSYNAGEDKMELLSIHNSLFNSRFNPLTVPESNQRGQATIPSTAPEVRIIRNKAIDTDASRAKATKFVANKNSGIFITRLEPIELWLGEDSQFKFDPNIIPTYSKKVFTTVDSDNFTSTEIVYAPSELIESQHITGDEAGLDTIVQKKIKSKVDGNNFVDGFFQAFDIQTPVPEDTSLITDVVGSNTIIAQSKIGASIFNEGAYYKISVDMGYTTQLLGNNNNNTISSIISKYYSQNSYTSSYSEGSVPYQHQGDEPLYVSNIRIRILDPDNTLSENIGDRNSIFLEVVKSQ